MDGAEFERTSLEQPHETLRREILEEVCATVIDSRRLGYSGSVCVEGLQADLVLVRSI